jgi:hypothetical protein
LYKKIPLLGIETLQKKKKNPGWAAPPWERAKEGDLCTSKCALEFFLWDTNKA